MQEKETKIQRLKEEKGMRQLFGDSSHGNTKINPDTNGGHLLNSMRLHKSSRTRKKIVGMRLLYTQEGFKSHSY